MVGQLVQLLDLMLAVVLEEEHSSSPEHLVMVVLDICVLLSQPTWLLLTPTSPYLAACECSKVAMESRSLENN